MTRARPEFSTMASPLQIGPAVRKTVDRLHPQSSLANETMGIEPRPREDGQHASSSTVAAPDLSTDPGHGAVEDPTAVPSGRRID